MAENCFQNKKDTKEGVETGDKRLIFWGKANIGGKTGEGKWGNGYRLYNNSGFKKKKGQKKDKGRKKVKKMCNPFVVVNNKMGNKFWNTGKTHRHNKQKRERNGPSL